MPYRLLNYLAVAVPIIWGHPSVQRGWRGYCCVCSCICCYVQGFIASIATIFWLQCKVSVCKGVAK